MSSNRQQRAARIFAHRRQLAAFLALVQRVAEPSMDPGAFAAFVRESDAVAVALLGIPAGALAREMAQADRQWTADDQRAFAQDVEQRRAVLAQGIVSAFLRVRDASMDAASRVLAEAGPLGWNAALDDLGSMLAYIRWFAGRFEIALPEFTPIDADTLRSQLLADGWTFVEASAGDPVYDSQGHRCGVLSEAEAHELRQQVRARPDGVAVR